MHLGGLPFEMDRDMIPGAWAAYDAQGIVCAGFTPDVGRLPTRDDLTPARVVCSIEAMGALIRLTVAAPTPPDPFRPIL